MGLLDILSDPRATQRQMTRMTLHLEDLSAFEAGLIRQHDIVLVILDRGKKEGA
jgi:hypothetical protein